MKYLILGIGLLVMNLQNSFAQTTLTVTTEKQKYSMYSDLIQGIADEHAENLSEPFETKMGCYNVKIKMNVFKEPGVFSKGIYSLTLTAKCFKSFTDFTLKPVYGEDYGNPWSLTVSFKTADGKMNKIYSEQISRD